MVIKMKSFISILVEQYDLMESLDSVIQANPDIPESVIRHYHTNALDDNNKSDRALNFVLKLHRKGHITPDNAKDLKHHMTAVSRANLFSKLKEVDSLDKLKNVTLPHIDNITTKRERINASSPTVFENDHIKITQHLDHEAAIRGSRLHPENPVYHKCNEPGKAQWCVSTDNKEGSNHFNNYTSYGAHPLYTIFNKQTKRVHALVANPSKNIHDFELRDERDYRTAGTSLGNINNFINSHHGIEDSPVGKHIFRISPESKEIHKQLPRNISSDQLENIINPKPIDHKPLSPDEMDDLDKWISTLSFKDLDNKKEKTTHVDHHDLVQAALSHPNITREQLKNAIESGTPHKIHGAIQNPHFTGALIDKVLDMPDAGYRKEVAKKSLEPHQLKRALADENDEVREKAAEFNDLSNIQINHAINDRYIGVRLAAIQKPNTTTNHLHKILDNPRENPVTKLVVMRHPEANKSILQRGLQDPNLRVQHEAKERLSKGNYKQ